MLYRSCSQDSSLVLVVTTRFTTYALELTRMFKYKIKFFQECRNRETLGTPSPFFGNMSLLHLNKNPLIPRLSSKPGRKVNDLIFFIGHFWAHRSPAPICKE